MRDIPLIASGRRRLARSYWQATQPCVSGGCCVYRHYGRDRRAQCPTSVAWGSSLATSSCRAWWSCRAWCSCRCVPVASAPSCRGHCWRRLALPRRCVDHRLRVRSPTSRGSSSTCRGSRLCCRAHPSCVVRRVPCSCCDRLWRHPRSSYGCRSYAPQSTACRSTSPWTLNCDAHRHCGVRLAQPPPCGRRRRGRGHPHGCRCRRDGRRCRCLRKCPRRSRRPHRRRRPSRHRGSPCRRDGPRPSGVPASPCCLRA